MTPLLGDAFFTSAMSAGLLVRCAALLMAPMKSLGAPDAAAWLIRRPRGSLCLNLSISTALCQMISSRMLRGLLSSEFGTLKSTGPHACLEMPSGGLLRIIISCVLCVCGVKWGE